MAQTVVLSPRDALLFLLSAVRYTAGRKSYVGSWIREQVRSIAPKLAPASRGIIVEDIEQRWDLIPAETLREWRELLDWLKDENNFLITFYTERTRCIHRLRARDIPCGLDPDDVMLECEKDRRCPMSGAKKAHNFRCVHRLIRRARREKIGLNDIAIPCRFDAHCPNRKSKRKAKKHIQKGQKSRAR